MYLGTVLGSFERLFDESLRSERAELKPLELEVLFVLLITKKENNIIYYLNIYYAHFIY